jgi:hypothetical protein
MDFLNEVMSGKDNTIQGFPHYEGLPPVLGQVAACNTSNDRWHLDCSTPIGGNKGRGVRRELPMTPSLPLPDQFGQHPSFE